METKGTTETENYLEARIEALTKENERLEEEIASKNKVMQVQHERITDTLLAIRMQVEGGTNREDLLKLIDKYR
jgi:hypothetical protein